MLELDRKLEALLAGLRPLGRTLVAYSGGVDSAFLAAAAHRALGEGALAVTAVSPSLAKDELDAAKATAEAIGIRHELLETKELEDPRYAANPSNRCYFCKSELFKELQALGGRLGIPAILYGALVDDRGDARPGAQAAQEAGARAPLDEAGLTKAEVRELSRRWGLPTAEKPSSPCLASRLPYGTPVTLERLSRVERAEAALRRLGFLEFRVRHHEETARLELGAAELARVADEPTRASVLQAVREAGYRWVTVDLAGLQSGGFNRRWPF